MFLRFVDVKTAVANGDVHCGGIEVEESVGDRNDGGVDFDDVGVDAVAEIDRGGSARQSEDLPLGGERVDLVGIEVHLERGEELSRIRDLALPIDELAQPLEPGVVRVRPQTPLLVLPVRRDAALGDQVHLSCADLDLEGLSRLADHGRVE